MKKIISLICIIIIFTFNIEVNASTFDCTYNLNLESKQFTFKFSVDSKTGFKSNYSANCKSGETTDTTSSNLGSSAIKICNTSFSEPVGIIQSLNELALQSNGSYACPGSIGVGDKIKSTYFFGSSVYKAYSMSKVSSTEYTCGVSFGTCPDSKDCAYMNPGYECIKDYYTCKGPKHDGTCPPGYYCSRKDANIYGCEIIATETCSGTKYCNNCCPSGQTCEQNSSGVYSCKTQSNTPAEQCKEINIPHKNLNKCYKISYRLTNGYYQPYGEYYSNTECTGSTTSMPAFEYNGTDKTWISKNKYKQTSIADLVLPAITNCDQAPASSSIKFTNETGSGNGNVGSVGGNVGKSPSFGMEYGGELDCDVILGANGVLAVKAGIIALRVLTPILLFTLTTVEFMKVIPTQDEDAMLKAWKKFGTRAIITVIIMLLPTFMNIIGTLTGVFDSCTIW